MLPVLHSAVPKTVMPLQAFAVNRAHSNDQSHESKNFVIMNESMADLKPNAKQENRRHIVYFEIHNNIEVKYLDRYIS